MPAESGGTGAALPSSVAVVGLGLIGASLCRALRAAAPDMAILGVTRRQETAELAVHDRVCNEASIGTGPLRDVDVVVLCTPVDAMPWWLRTCAQVARPDTLVTDCGSTKAWVTAEASVALGPERFLGGHPMAGREHSGYTAAETALFDGCTWVVTPGPETVLERFAPWLACIEAVGAHLEVMAPHEHDLIVAQISHVPFALAAAVMRAAAAAPSWDRGSRLASTGFRDAVRLAGGDAEMYAAITTTNASAIREGLAAVELEVQALRRVLEDRQRARLYFEEARRLRREWLDRREAAGRPVP